MLRNLRLTVRFVLPVVLGACVCARTIADRNQQPTAADAEMMKTWSMQFADDKLTDKHVLTATATAYAVGVSSSMYQLTMKCDGVPEEMTLKAWTKTAGLAGKTTARPIPWTSRIVETGGEVTSRDATTGVPRAYAPLVDRRVFDPMSFHYRIDGETANSSVLTRVSDNTASLHPVDVFVAPPPSINSGGALSSDQERALARMAAISRGESMTMTLPKLRLLIADVFPGELVEFNFRTLTPDARSALRKMCQFDTPTVVAPAAAPSTGGRDTTSATTRPVPTAPPSPVWRDRASNEALPIPDLWLRPGALKPLTDDARLREILKVVDTPVVKDQFETTDAFEQRQRKQADDLTALLTEPLFFVGLGGAGPGHAFQYDADNGVMRAVVSGRNDGLSSALVSSRVVGSTGTGSTYLKLDLPHPELVILVPSAAFIKSAQPYHVALFPVTCSVPLPVAEARDRLDHLSLLFSVRVRTMMAAGRSNSRSYSALTDAPDDVHVWIVDSVAHERLADLPLSSCIVR